MSTQTDNARLVAIDTLDETGVTVVEHPDHGALAVGLSGDTPFAVSNKCRHLFKSLGDGKVTAEGRLECPAHGAQYDVADGSMVAGPGGVFKPLGGVVKGTTGRRKLDVYPVEIRDGAIWLSG